MTSPVQVVSRKKRENGILKNYANLVISKKLCEITCSGQVIFLINKNINSFILSCVLYWLKAQIRLHSAIENSWSFIKDVSSNNDPTSDKAIHARPIRINLYMALWICPIHTHSRDTCHILFHWNPRRPGIIYPGHSRPKAIWLFCVSPWNAL